MTPSRTSSRRRLVFMALMAITALVPIALMAYKFLVLDYPLAGLIPAVSYEVELVMQVDGHGGDISAGTYLPKTDTRQIIRDEVNSSGSFALSLAADGPNRVATWNAENVEGEHTLRYTYAVQAEHVRYEISPEMPVAATYPAGLEAYVAVEPGIQVEDPLIAEALHALFPTDPVTMLDALTRIHRHLQDDFKNRPFSGFTDAVTALKLKEASCNGKSRLFIAFARKLGIPSRLVGGLIMAPGSKRVSHQWVEVYIGGHWVPFDTINDHFAEIPANYLTLYYGDQVLFKHTANINFQYFFKMTKRLVPRRDAQEALGASMLNMLNVYAVFERVGIPQDLLKIVLMIPVGALVTVIFRNVIGLETFGTFLPALIAAAARESGLFWGLIGFLLIIGISALLRKALDWLQLLHSPKMAIMLTAVVIVMLLLSVGSVQFGLLELAHVSLFPIAILAITAERFALIETEQGFRKAAKITLMTVVVIIAAYLVMDSLFLQSMIVAFPELLLVVIALDLWLGKWVGLRVAEFIRFRRLIFGRNP